MSSSHNPGDVFEKASAWLGEGRKVALATVVDTWGSSPRPVGSQLVIDDQSCFYGSVSGGCVENAVIEAAQEVLAEGGARFLEYGVDDGTVMGVGLTCGGTLRVYVECIE